MFSLMRTIPTAFALALIACGPGGRSGGGGGDGGSGSGGHLEIAPANAMVTVVNNVAVAEEYTAMLYDTDGHATDVTAQATFDIADPGYGNWSGATLTVTGLAVGPTQITATVGSGSDVATGGTGLTVFSQGSRADGSGVPTNASNLFGSATETAGKAPTIAYPAAGVIVPPNIGELDVHWVDTAGNNLWAITMENQYITWTVYTAATNPDASSFTPAEWASLASSRLPLQLTVAGLNTTAPTQKGTSAPQAASATNELVQGGVYYWQNIPTQGVYRYDMSTPNMPTSSFFPAGQQPTTCLGCHALSRDGTKIALTLDGGGGRGTVLDVGNYNVDVPYATNPVYWNFATFTPDNTELVTVLAGAMSLRQTAGGAVIATIPSSPGLLGDQPELSPDGTKLANVETIFSGGYSYDYMVAQGSIVMRTFDQATNAFGPIQQLVPNATGAANYYPSWSPDSQWILFTRTAGNSYSEPTAEAWVVKADGSQPPIQLMTADTTGTGLTNSWARWAPFPQTYGPNDEALYYITFSSTRPYGVIPLTPSGYYDASGTEEMDPQIWMAPFFPDRATSGQDPSGPAFRMPFQTLAAGNHIAQWADAVVIGRKSDGSPLTQAEAAGVVTTRRR